MADIWIERFRNCSICSTPGPSVALTLDEQGIFVLGYYHQRAAFYTRSTDVEPTTTEMTQV
jgi:CRISPR-associated protein (Cas_Csd1).